MSLRDTVILIEEAARDNAGDLSSYAAEAAVNVLVGNWKDALSHENHYTVESLIVGDIDEVIAHLTEFRALARNHGAE